jgi:hypothetical protein
MKKTFLLFVSIYALLILPTEACKSKQKTETSAPASTTPVNNQDTNPKTTGTISHTYSKCGTVIVVPDPKGGTPIILIPGTSIGEFDIEGMEICFHYHPLKRKNPDGCMTGFPVNIFDISKK